MPPWPMLARLAAEHKVELVAIGNGTASRETDKLAGELIARNPGLSLAKIVVSEAGASVYSASAYASRELPALDVSLRGAVSIARRLQDPLAELVKIDPKSIGVGQYQHDIPEPVLARALDTVVEDCVNAVGVDVNTASAPLLDPGVRGRAGSGGEHRHAPGRQRAVRGPDGTEGGAAPRAEGVRALRRASSVSAGRDPLDVSSVHPEAYPVVRRIVAAAGGDVRSLIGNAPVLRSLHAGRLRRRLLRPADGDRHPHRTGEAGPGPAAGVPTARFAEGVEKVGDLQPGMVLEGVVTNVAAFGAFVDVGVHQDGLVHVSAMARRVRRRPARGGEVR